MEIAEGCAAAGLKLLVDFHYSDFWADPGKQQTPKAWAGYSLEQKAEAIGSFTTQSLQKIAGTGADIDMVQVGNETTNSFVEEKGDSYADMCALFQAGSQAIRAFDKDIRVVIHFTNPERSNQLTNWAQRLQDNGVDYDILATSYYPYWHGTLDNLKSQFQAVQNTYGKDAYILYRCACGAEKTVPLTAQIQGLPDSISLYLGRSVNLVASFTTGELPEGVSRQSVYASSNPKVLRVSDQGRLIPIRMGACDITYSVLATVTLADSSQTVVVAQQTVPVTVSIKLFDLPECDPGHHFPIWWPVIKSPYPQFQTM